MNDRLKGMNFSPKVDGSVVDSINEGGANSGGQESEDFDFGGEGFNHNWN